MERILFIGSFIVFLFSNFCSDFVVNAASDENALNCTKEKIFVFAGARTGSTELVMLLRSTGLIDMYHEVFLPRLNANDSPNELISKDVLSNRLVDPQGYINALCQVSTKSAFGFKIFYDQLNSSLVQSVLLEGNQHAKKIILYRSDLLAQFTSHSIADKTGFWQGRNTSSDKCVLDTSRFNYYEKSLLGWYSFVSTTLHKSNQQYFLINYENDLLKPDDIRATIGRLGIFLDLPLSQTKFHATLPKQANIPLEAQISNWNKLSVHMKNYHTKRYSFSDLINF